MSKHKEGSLFKGILLVAGTSIGGGMLALPVLTSETGFFPSIVIYLLCWMFMACTGMLMLEACSWMGPDSNLVSMAAHTLGPIGKCAAWALYLFLFYCLTLAYIVGCGDLVVDLFHGSIPEWLGSLIFLALFGPLVWAGARLAGRVNVFLMVGLGLSYCAFVVLGFRYIQPELLLHADWTLATMALPIAFTAFAFQGMIPTLVTYMGGDVILTRKAILIGSFMPFFVYVIWQALILGIVPPYAPGGLVEALKSGENAVQPLKNFLNNPSVYIIGQCFAFFALVTSFLGVSLGLVDFLADGLKIRKTRIGKIGLCLLVFVPPFLFALWHKGVFLMALDYAGGFGCATLLGLMPILMVWSGRYYLNLGKKPILPGGRLLLTILLLFVLFELVCQVQLVLSN